MRQKYRLVVFKVSGMIKLCLNEFGVTSHGMSWIGIMHPRILTSAQDGVKSSAACSGCSTNDERDFSIIVIAGWMLRVGLERRMDLAGNRSQILQSARLWLSGSLCKLITNLICST
jgi:hypothetical protein